MTEEELWCPECEEWIKPKVTRSYEQEDADGNKGVMITFLECPICENVIENLCGRYMFLH